MWQSLSHSRKQVAIVCPAARRPGNLLEGGVSLTWKHRAPSHKDHPFPEQKREPSGCSVFNMTLLPFGCVTGILHMAYFLESDFLLLTLKKKKKKPFKKLTDHKDGVSLPWETTVSIWTPGPDVPFDSALFHTRVSLLR